MLEGILPSAYVRFVNGWYFLGRLICHPNFPGRHQTPVQIQEAGQPIYPYHILLLP